MHGCKTLWPGLLLRLIRMLGQGSRVDLQQRFHNKTDHLRSVVGHVLVMGSHARLS